MHNYGWLCPFCEQHATITDENLSIDDHILREKTARGLVGVRSIFTVCPNNDCRKFTLMVLIRGVARTPTNILGLNMSDKIADWQLVPFGASRVFPDFVPRPIREDYEEACRIKDLSPKASATLARRAAQGVIRDFWGIAKPTLKLELDALKERADVPHEIWEAIDAVREVGNIGAHMEKDIDLIVDVDPNEAAALIDFVEMLIDETYVAREQRRTRLEKVKKVAADKKTAMAKEPPTS